MMVRVVLVVVVEMCQSAARTKTHETRYDIHGRTKRDRVCERVGRRLRCFSYNGLRRCELSSENR